jgi:hypothetical protein
LSTCVNRFGEFRNLRQPSTTLADGGSRKARATTFSHFYVDAATTELVIADVRTAVLVDYARRCLLCSRTPLGLSLSNFETCSQSTVPHERQDDDGRAASVRSIESEHNPASTRQEDRMQFRPRYLVLAAIALALASSNTTVRASESCEALREWARPYADTSPTLAELMAFHGGHRRAIFNAIAPAARLSLWREHLGALAARPEFTPAQRAAAAELRTVIVAEIYTTGSPAQERARALWKDRAALFDVAQRRAFVILGAPSAAPAGLTTWCECSASYGHVECYPRVCGSANGCTGYDGCGFGGFEPCIAMCE